MNDSTHKPRVVNRRNKKAMWTERIIAWQDAGDPRGRGFVNQRMMRSTLSWMKALQRTDLVMPKLLATESSRLEWGWKSVNGKRV